MANTIGGPKGGPSRVTITPPGIQNPTVSDPSVTKTEPNDDVAEDAAADLHTRVSGGPDYGDNDDTPRTEDDEDDVDDLDDVGDVGDANDGAPLDDVADHTPDPDITAGFGDGPPGA